MATVIFGSLWVVSLIIFVTSAPLSNNRIDKVEAEELTSKTTCPFTIVTDVNEKRIPVKIDRIKCAAKADCSHCETSDGYHCVQAYKMINVTYMDEIDKKNAVAALVDGSNVDADHLVVKEENDVVMYGTSKTTNPERIEIGCFCAKLNQGAKPAEVLGHVHPIDD